MKLKNRGNREHGVNETPALAASNVGIVVVSGTEVPIETGEILSYVVRIYVAMEGGIKISRSI